MKLNSFSVQLHSFTKGNSARRVTILLEETTNRPPVAIATLSVLLDIIVSSGTYCPMKDERWFIQLKRKRFLISVSYRHFEDWSADMLWKILKDGLFRGIQINWVVFVKIVECKRFWGRVGLQTNRWRIESQHLQLSMWDIVLKG